jgi:WD40 repeat protein
VKPFKLLVLGAALMTGLVACPRENIIFSTDARIVRGNWAGTAKRVCANVSQTAWSPDSTKIVSNGKRTVIWDAVTGARVRVIAEESAQVVWTEKNIITASAFRSETNNYGIKVKFWNPSSGVLERSLSFDQNYGSSIQVSPDGTRAVLTSRNLDDVTVSLISLTDGTKQRDLDVGAVQNGTSLWILSSQWSADGSKIIVQGEIRGVVDYSVPATPFVRVWQASTGTIERNISSASNAVISPDGKTLVYGDGAYAQPNTGLKFLNLETGDVRSLANAQGGLLGWNPSGSKFYLQASEGNVTEVWNLGTFKLEKSIPGGGFAWNSLGAPADTGVTSYANYESCSLKILDLNTLKTTRTLDETALDPLEIKLFLKATYLTESEYGITGTANVAGTDFKVRGLEDVWLRKPLPTCRCLPASSFWIRMVLCLGACPALGGMTYRRRFTTRTHSMGSSQT